VLTVPTTTIAQETAMPMPMPKTESAFEAIDPNKLEIVAGGAARSSKNDDITAALSSITSSLKDLSASKNQGMDPMNMILIMMMMGGFGGGGGGGGVVAGAGVAAPPVINVDTAMAGGGGGWCGPRPCGKGKKGW
jgi:hypothetical protein